MTDFLKIEVWEVFRRLRLHFLSWFHYNILFFYLNSCWLFWVWYSCLTLWFFIFYLGQFGLQLVNFLIFYFQLFLQDSVRDVQISQEIIMRHRIFLSKIFRLVLIYVLSAYGRLLWWVIVTCIWVIYLIILPLNLMFLLQGFWGLSRIFLSLHLFTDLNALKLFTTFLVDGFIFIQLSAQWVTLKSWCKLVLDVSKRSLYN